MRRLNRGRAATDVEAKPQDPAASESVDAATDAQPGDVAVPVDGEAATTRLPVAPATDATAAPPPESLPGSDLPAGVDPSELAAAPDSSARRGRLRRRVRYLRAVRELLLRDLGGFVHEAHRSEAGVEGHRALLETKSRRLSTLDLEVRTLESHLGEAHGQTVLRRAGIGGSCPQCGELHGSEARFCSRCGNPLMRGRGARTSVPGRPAPTGPAPISAAPADEGPKASTASLWGRPKRPTEPAKHDAAIATGEQAAARPEPGAGAGNVASGDAHVTSGDPLSTTRPPVAQRAGGPAGADPPAGAGSLADAGGEGDTPAADADASGSERS
jgi:hypothetical protein